MCGAEHGEPAGAQGRAAGLARGPWRPARRPPDSRPIAERNARIGRRAQPLRALPRDNGGLMSSPTSSKPSRPGADEAAAPSARPVLRRRSEEHTSELQSQSNLVCRLLLEKKKKKYNNIKFLL